VEDEQVPTEPTVDELVQSYVEFAERMEADVIRDVGGVLPEEPEFDRPDLTDDLSYLSYAQLSQKRFELLRWANFYRRRLELDGIAEGRAKRAVQRLEGESAIGTPNVTEAELETAREAHRITSTRRALTKMVFDTAVREEDLLERMMDHKVEWARMNQDLDRIAEDFERYSR
jgi:hypothetical protein